jgi:hypothetical protein
MKSDSAFMDMQTLLTDDEALVIFDFDSESSAVISRQNAD